MAQALSTAATLDLVVESATVEALWLDSLAIPFLDAAGVAAPAADSLTASDWLPHTTALPEL